MGKIERQLQHIVDTVLALINHAKLPLRMWDYGAMAAVTLYNLNPTALLARKSPSKALLEKNPEYGKLWTFGCKVFPLLSPLWEHKLDNKSNPHIFLAYLTSFDSYMCLDPWSGQVIPSYDAHFIKHDFSLNDILHDSIGTCSSRIMTPYSHNSQSSCRWRSQSRLTSLTIKVWPRNRFLHYQWTLEYPILHIDRPQGAYWGYSSGTNRYALSLSHATPV